MATVSDEPIVVVCANDEIAVVDTIPLNYDCPPILARFLGISRLSDEILSVFKAPDRDELGRLTFVKYFDISRSNFFGMHYLSSQRPRRQFGMSGPHV